MNVTSSSLILSWTPNFGGGVPQGYLVRYRTDKETKYQVVEISGGEAVSTTLSNLQSNTNYIFTIQAKNDQGLSAYVTPPIIATMQEIAGEASTAVGANWRIPRLMVLILTLSGAALLVLNVSIIACFLRRRKNVTRNTSASSSSKSVALDAYGITPASTPGANQCDALLSLTTMSSTNFSNTTLPQKDDDRINEDDIDQTSLVILNTGVSSQPQSQMAWILGKQQNGDLLRSDGLPLESFDEQHLLTGDNEIQEEGNGTEITETAALNANLLEPANFVPSPEVTSLCSSIYDALPCESQHESCKNSYINEDKVSLASYHTDTIGAYPRTYSCLLNSSMYPPGSEVEPLMSEGQFQMPLGYHHSHGYQPLVQSHQQQIYTHQEQPQQEQQMQQHVSQQQQNNPHGMMPYDSAYTEGTNYFDTKCSRSFSMGTPLGYSTLGSRGLRIPTSESSLQYQPLYPDYSRTAMESLSMTESVQGDTTERLRRSSFHGQMQRGVAGVGKPGISQHIPHGLPKSGSCVVHRNDLLSKSGSNLALFPQHESSVVGIGGGSGVIGGGGGGGHRVTFASPEVSTSFVETNTTEVETSCAVSGNMASQKTLASCSSSEMVANSSL
ncbi:uncharacterized protein [Palaemon carinicauda]|uniref:uncharacterized protein n=1 Tax=Palaemon carinicauda TaxID=392227 RepID=UPI0035B5C1E6